MDAFTGRIFASLGWTIGLVASVAGFILGKTEFRLRMVGFAVPLAYVASLYWVLAFHENFGLTSAGIQPWFQVGQILIGPMIAVQIYMTYRHYQQQEAREREYKALLDSLLVELGKFNDLNEAINGHSYGPA